MPRKRTGYDAACYYDGKLLGRCTKADSDAYTLLKMCIRDRYWDEEYQDKEMYNWYKKLMQIRKAQACIVEGEMIETITNDDDDTICLLYTSNI